MAGVVSEQRTVSEIEKLKSVAQCKIIRNVGDFSYLIDAAVADSDILIKFQLTADYPTVRPTMFIKNSSMTKDEIQKVVSSIHSSIPSDTTSLVEIFEAARDLMSSQPASEQSVGKKVSPKSTRSSKQKNGDKPSDAHPSKKPAMRTAADVIKRIQWDSSLQSDRFIVGYLDRFLGVQEQPFNAFNWVNPAEADWMDLNIPEHRIEYFKYKDKIVWEKKSRLDNVFGSTGGVTIDQFLAMETTSTAALSDGPQSAAPDVEFAAMKDKSKESTDSSCDEDDVEITIGKVNCGNPQRKTIPKPVSKNRPNHFIAIPITEPCLMESVRGIQDEYLTLGESDGEQYLTESYNLHITLCAVRIDSQDELDTVNQTMYDLVLAQADDIRQNLAIGKLDSFWSRVLYAKATLNEKFHEFVLQLRKGLQERHIRTFDSDEEFVPHLTLLKFPRYCNDIHFSVDHYLTIKRESQTDDVNQSVVLDRLVLYSMERDDNNHYIQKFTLDV